jgi:hypothetical protein
MFKNQFSLKDHDLLVLDYGSAAVLASSHRNLNSVYVHVPTLSLPTLSFSDSLYLASKSTQVVLVLVFTVSLTYSI